MRALFATDLHGRADRYEKLFALVERERPRVLFLGGDLLPHPYADAARVAGGGPDFIYGVLAAGLERLRGRVGAGYPEVLVILGNDDGRFPEAAFLDVSTRGLWTYAHDRRLRVDGYMVVGYSYVPPTPFRLKDWERYDVSRYVDPGCTSPEEGARTVPSAGYDVRYGTIQGDLEALAGTIPMDATVMLFHAPPHETALDVADLAGTFVDHVPLDPHVGSIAIRRFIERRQPLLTLHGHVHESARLSGAWRDRIGRTEMFGAAHDGPELAVVRFDLEELATAERLLL